MVTPRFLLLSWTVVVPLLAIVALAPTWGRDLGVVLVVAVAVIPAGAVLAAVHHAEVVAHRVGEPFGSLVLAVAVTVIAVALIVTVMVSGGPETASLARDTVFAAVMITTNGIVGISLLLGALRYGVTLFNAEGSGAALATVGRGQCPHRGPGSGHPAAGRRSPCPARCVPVPRHLSLTSRGTGRTAFHVLEATIQRTCPRLSASGWLTGMQRHRGNDVNATGPRPTVSPSQAREAAQGLAPCGQLR